MKNSPKGEIPWDLYFDFYQADAIAGISGGTTIKYIDTQTYADLNITNILGFIRIGNFEGAMRLALYYNNLKKYIMPLRNDGHITSDVVDIRVFYID